VQQKFEFGSESFVVKRTEMFSLTQKSEYHKRGWTYQEFLMSARRLIFLEGEAHWRCQCCEWHEGVARDVQVSVYTDPYPQTLVAGFPDLLSFERLLAGYNKRSFTYDEDALPAIAGLLAVLSRTFTGGFLYGLPEMCIDTSLGWEVYHYTFQTEKRVPSQPEFYDQCMPTWSWISLRGLVVWGGSGESRVRDSILGEEDMQTELQETSPITQWYASSAIEGGPRREIVSTWYKERERAKDPHQPLAEGWSRLEATAGLLEGQVRLFPDGCGSFVYQHRNQPTENRERYWYYPFRVRLIEPSTPFYNPAQMRYLSCKTWKSRVLACRMRETQSSERSRAVYLRKDMSQRLIGVMLLDTTEQWNRWARPGDTNDDNTGPSAHIIEVVAINRCVTFHNRNNAAAEHGCPPVGRMECVTVLWVEWQGAFYTRQACGRIEREAWEALDLEEIDLVLG
jgi:hypothetical protein